MKKVIAVMIFAAVLAVGFFGLMVPRPCAEHIWLGDGRL